MRITLQTDLNVKNLHVVLGENWLPDHWTINKNLSTSLVNGQLYNQMLGYNQLTPEILEDQK